MLTIFRSSLNCLDIAAAVFFLSSESTGLFLSAREFTNLVFIFSTSELVKYRMPVFKYFRHDYYKIRHVILIIIFTVSFSRNKYKHCFCFIFFIAIILFSSERSSASLLHVMTNLSGRENITIKLFGCFTMSFHYKHIRNQ